MDKVQEMNICLQNYIKDVYCNNYFINKNYFYYDFILSGKAKIKNLESVSKEISTYIKAPCFPEISFLVSEGKIRFEYFSPRTDILNFFDLYNKEPEQKSKLSCLLGESKNSDKVYLDIKEAPHVLVSGTTGSGKSSLLHNFVANFLLKDDVEIYLVDPKRCEFFQYEDVNKTSVTYDVDEAIVILKDIVEIMNFRYSKRNNYHPIVVIIDEFADLIIQDVSNEIMKYICILAQKARAARIHLILSTQRPSIDIVKGVIKANFPTRIACKVATHVDSKVILDKVGAENLYGKGDAILKDPQNNFIRFQIAYTNPEEVISKIGLK